MAHPITDALVAAGSDQAARQLIKASAYGSLPTPDALTAGTRMVAIIDGPTMVSGNLVRVVLALWIDFGFGMELQDLGNLNPFFFRNPPILVPDPGGDIVRTWTNPDGSTGSAVFREDLDGALMQACYDAVERFVGTGGVM
jgi:hypothetical protein